MERQHTQQKLGAHSAGLDTMSWVCEGRGGRLAWRQLVKGYFLEEFWVKL